MSAEMATLKELTEHYSLEDTYLMLEVLSVDVHNRKVAEEIARRNRA